MRAALVALLFLVAAAEGEALAQPVYFGNERPRESSAVMVGYTTVDFTYAGDDPPPTTLEFTGPVVTAMYSRTNAFISASWGTQAAADTASLDLGYLDLSLVSWAEMFFSEAAREALHRIFVPITVYTNFRRVSPRDIDILNDFSITTIGLGVGVGYYGQFTDRILLELRVTPAIGVALQSFSDSAGSARLVDADAQLHIASVADRFGITIGYHSLFKRWNVGGSSIFVTRSEDLFEYGEQRHTVALGVNW